MANITTKVASYIIQSTYTESLTIHIITSEAEAANLLWLWNIEGQVIKRAGQRASGLLLLRWEYYTRETQLTFAYK